jgi:hypothetical protein
MIDANTEIGVTLTAQQWEIVLRMLDDGPRRVVNPIFLSIQQQCQQADADLVGNVAQFPSSA